MIYYRIFFSGQCVNKEWIFHSIVSGKILPVNGKHTVEENNDSDDSHTLELPALNKVLVQTSGSTEGKRTLKRQCCVYCEKLDPKLPRHMETKHEIEVAKILSLKKGSKERKKAWALLAAKGNNMHNLKVRQKGSGLLIPKYRPTTLPEPKKYLPCEFCRMLIVSSDLWKHHRSCVGKPKDVKSDAPSRNSRLLLPIQESVDKEFRESVVVNIRDDVIGQKAKTDPLILEFGERRFEKTGMHEHTYTHIACRMRELARLVLAMQKKSSINTLSKCISPSVWSSLVQTIKEEAGFDPEHKTFSSPSFAIKVGHSLKKAAMIMKTKSAEAGDFSNVERITMFLGQYKDEYDERVASLARECLASSKFNNVKYLPLVEDVAKLSKHLDSEINNIKKDIGKMDKIMAYKDFCKLVLAQVILFNRKRSGEAERLKKDDFLNCSLKQSVDEEVSKSLTEFEKHLCQSHLRVETRGKRGRKVSVLFTNSMKSNVDFLVNLQDELQINSKYVFMRPNGQLPFRGVDVLKEIALSANLKFAERITSTSLRKQLATMCQVMNLTENSQDIIARFMGHDIRIHRQYYRLPQGTLETAKVSKVLHLINSGKISKVAGADLDDIDVQTLVGKKNTLAYKLKFPINLKKIWKGESTSTFSIF